MNQRFWFQLCVLIGVEILFNAEAVAAILNVPSAQFPTIQSAVDAAVIGDEIVLDDGLYTGPGNTDVTILVSGITIRSANGPVNCVIDGLGAARAFIIQSPGLLKISIQGLTLRSCHAVFNGGAIELVDGTLTLENCVFESNSADIRGGAIHADNSNLTVCSSEFSTNSVVHTGGAIWAIESHVELIDSSFFNNRATGALNIQGRGGAYASDVGTSSIISGCTFEGNETGVDEHCNNFVPNGGAIHDPFVDAEILNCVFRNNKSVIGGAIVGGLVIDGCLFEQNTGTCSGGAIWTTSFSIIKNSRFIENTALSLSLFRGGGAVFSQLLSAGSFMNCVFVRNQSMSLGGAIFVRSGSGSLSFLNNTFIDNTALEDGDSIYSGEPQIILMNSILWGRSGRQIGADKLNFVTVINSNIAGGWSGPGEFVMDQDPLFSNPLNDDLHLQPTSPSIDTGNSSIANLPKSDFDGNPRIMNCSVDMGAFESIFANTTDCDQNLEFDVCEIGSNILLDCNENFVLDSCELITNDCNSNSQPDDCDIAMGFASDCNNNLIPDSCDIATGQSLDLNNNLIPDECDPDCNGNLIPDDLDIANGAVDVNQDGVPDECVCPSDCFVVDGVVSVVDLIEALGDWGTIGSPCDTNADGIVDVTDLLKILADWGLCPAP